MARGSLRQRSPGTWEVTVDLGRGPLGKRRRKFQTVRGTKAQAQRRLRELLSTLDQGGDIPTGRLTLGDWLQRWLRDHVRPRRRQGTAERYRYALDRIIPLLGHVELQDLRPQHIEAFEAKLLAGGLAPATVRMMHAVLTGSLRHAMRLELLNRNPAALVQPPPLARREVVPPDIDAVRRVLALARERGHHLASLFHVIAYTGRRLGEGLGLTWDDVDLERGFLRVSRSVSRSRERKIIVEPPKTDRGRRAVDLDAGTMDVLASHWHAQRAHVIDMREAYDDRGIVFANARGA